MNPSPHKQSLLSAFKALPQEIQERICDNMETHQVSFDWKRKRVLVDGNFAPYGAETGVQDFMTLYTEALVEVNAIAEEVTYGYRTKWTIITMMDNDSLEALLGDVKPTKIVLIYPAWIF